MKHLAIKPTITDYSEKSVMAYFKSISKIKPLTAKEEVELIKKYKAGDEEAGEKLIVSNLRFVISIAKQYQGMNIPLSDLIQEGNIGLLEAAMYFDPSRNTKFITYAVFRIRKQITMALSDQSRIIKLPRLAVDNSRKIKKAVNNFVNKYGRTPLSEELDIDDERLDTRKITDTIISAQPIESIDDENSFYIETKFDEDEDSSKKASSMDIPIVIHEILSSLPEMQRKVLTLYYGIGCVPITYDAISDILGISREGARLLHLKTIDELREKYSDELKELL